MRSSRGGGPAADGGQGRRRRAAAGGDPVVGHQAGVAHQHLDLVQGDAKLLGGGLTQLAASILPHFDLAAQDGDPAVGADVDPRAETRLSPPPGSRGACASA